MNTIPEDGTFELGLIDLISEQRKVNVLDFVHQTIKTYGDGVISRMIMDKNKKYRDFINCPQKVYNMRDQIIEAFILVYALKREKSLNWCYYIDHKYGILFIISKEKCEDLSEFIPDDLGKDEVTCLECEGFNNTDFINNLNFVFLDPDHYTIGINFRYDNIDIILKPSDFIELGGDVLSKNAYNINTISLYQYHRMPV